MKSPFKKVMCGVCLLTLLASAAPIYTVGAADVPSAASTANSSSSASSLKDGIYSMNFVIKKFGTDQDSVMQDYVINPGKLTVTGGKQLFSFTLKQSKENTAFKTELDGVLKDTKVIATNEEKNTREVQFEVKDLSKKLKAWIKVDWAAFNYFHEYDIEITFDQASGQRISEGTVPSDKEGSAGAAQGGASPSAPKDQPKTAESATSAPAKPTAPTPALTDVNNHWAKALIEEAVGTGIANGYEDGKFMPDGAISRSEFTVLISRALKLEGKKADLNYSDLNQIPQWIRPHLEQAIGAGIISSYEDNTFRPDRNITRAEIAVMIGRALGFKADSNEKLAFADEQQIPQWAYAQVAAASKKGIINGRDNNLYAPNASATRAEAVTLILALIKNVK
ncbi:S-layer homology domain-containing protein [Paenibacillus radicis (ex Xue et al. 2023)]|uniref:S-layer homology domain-containing protein n=1 Tax=Paenibacillus radicis (ex Xue et al. 2023) TaxID=2972489 RepID=A0ABT1YSD9_9BACL|nr:S-layer homology domain-containing protein [Paenibacillus radicis (ex Xue et al. 2023)]MCR8635645.1 S-layer homology domain-containing protein [Paenibacillus radicis (ex Xue et al. 2023)]